MKATIAAGSLAGGGSGDLKGISDLIGLRVLGLGISWWLSLCVSALYGLGFPLALYQDDLATQNREARR